ncbi:MAG: hypothetical protein GY909_02705 [Oligoflexia bacterium]|nr:hypothetical protein [Oligoflexia bacterium]
MKKLLAIVLTVASVMSFAGDDKLEIVRIKDASAQSVFAQAQDMVKEINSDTWGRTKFPYLRECNRPGGHDDFNFRRKAYTSSSFVSLNHVTGMYTALVKVRCED